MSRFIHRISCRLSVVRFALGSTLTIFSILVASVGEKVHIRRRMLMTRTEIRVSNDPIWWSSINAYRIGSYFAVSACAALIYEWVLTFEQEVELIWRRRWSLITVLYLSVRYLGIICAVANMICDVPTISLTDVGCHMTYVAQYWIAVVVSELLGIIMVIRLNAMYQRSRKMLIFLVVFFLAINISSGVITFVEMRRISGEELILSGTYQCSIKYEGDTPLLGAIAWIIGMVWEVLALCLAIWIAVKHFRELRRQSAGGIIRDYFTVLIKFHVLYFASYLVFSSFALFFLFSSTLENASPQIFAGFLLVVEMFVLGPRLILSIREYHAKLVAGSDTATAVTSIAFRHCVYVSTSSNV